MLKISCFIKEQNAGTTGPSWRWLMTPWKEKNNLSETDKNLDRYFLYKKLASVFSCFEEWVSIQVDCPAEGHVGSATLTFDDLDENHVSKANAILNRLKENYRFSIYCREINKDDL